MTTIEVRPDERISPFGHDPADIIAATDEASERVTRLLEAMRPAWASSALCRGEPIDWWFPGKGQRTDAAMEICGRCPVRLSCLAAALDDEDLDHGIRGGATVNARQLMRRNRTNQQSSLPAARAIHRYSKACTCSSCRAHRATIMRRWRANR